MSFLIVFDLVIACPILLLTMSRFWLLVAVPCGLVGLSDLCTAAMGDDPGPAGLLILGSFAVVVWINASALILRLAYDYIRMMKAA
ncbi:hypothetical protein [Sphingomonas abaci]|uniref:Uncharacterized protein n=1 Tax=Sphingomonas abaci TaxID=237611 RepID=A0A7W7EWK0_9SPHN|nr:hypothetical protein [Sphingomonas abaci]MBB4616622.1 hypothetical protein [Sphingomonas abaci]